MKNYQIVEIKNGLIIQSDSGVYYARDIEEAFNIIRNLAGVRSPKEIIPSDKES